MKKILLFTLIIFVSCIKKNESLIESNTLLSEYTAALDEEITHNQNYIYRHFCNVDKYKNDTFCIENTTLRDASKDFLSTTSSVNLAKDDFDTIIKMYTSKMAFIKSIHDKYAVTSISKINILRIEDMDEEKETLLILMRSSIIISKHKAFSILASRVSICAPIMDHEKECINKKPFVY